MANGDSLNAGDKAPQSETLFSEDQIIGGRYRVLSLLGRGGMGVVYQVEQIFIGKRLALKTLNKTNATGIALRRFQNEARAAFSLDHPNVVKVHDFGLMENETPYLVMDLLEGTTLSEKLRKDGRLPLNIAIPIFVQACFGLAYAHEKGVVHRDIKPANIIILNDRKPISEGDVKIVDFGIAKFTEHQEGEVQALTRTGEIFGSPLYMSPEQCSGGKIDHRSDIYSLGCVIFEALTGAPPFVGENALSTLIMHQSGKPLSLKQASLGEEFPQPLEQVMSILLAKSPHDRYQSLGLLAHDLAKIGHGSESTSLAIERTAPRAERPARSETITIKRSTLYMLLAAITSLALVLAGLLYSRLEPRLDSPPPINSKSATSPIAQAKSESDLERRKQGERVALVLESWNRKTRGEKFLRDLYRVCGVIQNPRKTIESLDEAERILQEWGTRLDHYGSNDPALPTERHLQLTLLGHCAYHRNVIDADPVRLRQAETFAMKASALNCNVATLASLEKSTTNLLPDLYLMLGYQYYSNTTGTAEYRKSLELYRKALLGYTPHNQDGIGDCQNYIGRVYSEKLDDAKEGIRFFELSRATFKKCRAKRILVCDNLQMLANLYEKTGASDRAGTIYLEAEPIVRELAQRMLLSVEYALDFYRRLAKFNNEKTPARNHIQLEISKCELIQETRKLFSEGKFAAAEAKQQSLLHLMRRTGAGSSELMADVLKLAGDIKRVTGKLRAASEYYAQAGKIIDLKKESAQAAEVILRQGIVSFQQEKLAEAENQFKTALRIQQSQKDALQVAETKQWLGQLYCSPSRGRFEHALSNYKDAESIYNKMDDATRPHVQYAGTLLREGLCFKAMNEPKFALERFKLAEAELRKFKVTGPVRDRVQVELDAFTVKN